MVYSRQKCRMFSHSLAISAGGGIKKPTLRHTTSSFADKLQSFTSTLQSLKQHLHHCTFKPQLSYA
ncbi:Protein of unknown function [Pyronema omphalodes CBS 100304]|uniref:Uncharacterized protein n=1 Tax=Pyronema omphalodes (strain CBS 100304) TaxID=1076935 RepID=U4KUJ2_PYROM|nr:Protein of unknown function [Pyronema omphalodes CBS 100304]CCX11339.1 Protein of unknown function [Pyronema omphalodes CBS 100304]